MRGPAVIIAALSVGTSAAAADLTVTVRTSAGQPVRDAVVSVDSGAGPGGRQIRFPWPQEMSQKDLQFDPFVLIAPVGGQVAFPNRDAVRHHVYSFSPAKRFELKLYGKGEAPSVLFDKTGVVAIGCNIHDSMVAFIKVVDTPYAAKTDASGVAVLRGVPAGSATLRVWRPYLRAPGNELTRTISVHDGSNAEAATADLRAPPAHRGAY